MFSSPTLSRSTAKQVSSVDMINTRRMLDEKSKTIEQLKTIIDELKLRHERKQRELLEQRAKGSRCLERQQSRFGHPRTHNHGFEQRKAAFVLLHRKRFFPQTEKCTDRLQSAGQTTLRKAENKQPEILPERTEPTNDQIEKI